MPKRFSKDDIAVMQALSKAGWTNTKIAKYFDCAICTVSQYVKPGRSTFRLHYQKDYRPREGSGIGTPEFIEKIKKEKANGKPVKAIAADNNISLSYVYHLLNGTYKNCRGVYRPRKLREFGLDRRIKLTADDIEEIKQLYATGNFTQYELADMFHVHQTTILYHVNPDRKKLCNEYSKVWLAVNKTPEELRETSRKAYQYRRNLIAKMSREDQMQLYYKEDKSNG